MLICLLNIISGMASELDLCIFPIRSLKFSALYYFQNGLRLLSDRSITQRNIQLTLPLKAPPLESRDSVTNVHKKRVKTQSSKYKRYLMKHKYKKIIIKSCLKHTNINIFFTSDFNFFISFVCNDVAGQSVSKISHVTS